MAPLPDPYDDLDDDARAEWERMAGARSHADGKPQLADVYVRMFNNPGLAEKVGALGEQIRFAGVLPDDVRELCILRFSARRRYGYEWAHHIRPAHQAGIDDGTIDAVTQGQLPEDLAADRVAALRAVDAVADGRSIPADVQDALVAAFGVAGTVEVAVLCGLYGIMGAVVTAFDVPVEDGFPAPPSPPF